AGVWSWQPNLALLQRDLAVLAGWPAGAAAAAAAYQGQTVWIGGADSPYITDDSVATMTALFPAVRRVTVKGAGHWVHSDQPEVFTAIIARWLGSAR
ncbi:MAG: alpha/beta hydrolase, partial [Nocardioides sp.]